MNNNNYKSTDCKQLTKLRTALAIAQGTQLFSTLLKEAEDTVSHDQTKRVTYLTMLFTRIHREMFHHWKDQATTDHRPGSIVLPAARNAFRKAIGRLVLDDGQHVDTAIFDSNGFVIKSDDIAEKLAHFYQDMHKIRPFSYGNLITLDFFMAALGHLPAFKSVYSQGIDFRRLGKGDAEHLHDPDSSHWEITCIFEHALDPTRNKNLQNPANGFGKWPENKRFLAGIPFLSHRTENGIDCYVTVTGGLVPCDTLKDDEFSRGQHFYDNPLSVSENIIGFLPGTEELRHPDKKFIDGIPIRKDGIAQLFCLDVNMLTGLRSTSHAEFLELLQECEGDKKQLFKLANNEPLKNKMIAAADGDERLKRTVEIAYDRLGKINRILINTRQTIFQGKTPVVNPKLFVCMGGAGAGKSVVQEVVQAQCGDNYVVASLDEFRKVSELYRVLTAANHHSDDYVYVEPFANRLRDIVALHAIEAGINLLYDGTGIPYQPRYSTIISQFKAAGFHTQVIAIDAFLIKPERRKEELSHATVIDRVKKRFGNTGRALPWVITIDKHIRAPLSFLTALEDQHLDKISLFANDGDFNSHYLVAESFSFSEREIKTLQQQQQAHRLIEFFRSIILEHNDSVLKNLAQHDSSKSEQLLKRNPDFREDNIAYQVYSRHTGQRALLIYNTRRMVDFIEKRQLNPNASGEEGLLLKPESLLFHVDPRAKEPWITRLQHTDTTDPD